MADEDQDSKTEEATAKRLSKAEEEGELLQSQEVKTAGQFLAIAVVVWLLAPFVMGGLSRVLSAFLDHPHAMRIGTVNDLVSLLAATAESVGLLVGVVLAVFMVFALITSVGQVGFHIVPQKLAFDFQRISPLSGLKRMVSLQAVVELLKSLAKMAVVGILSYVLLMPMMRRLELLVTMELGPTLSFLHGVLIKLLLYVTALVMVLAVLDWVYQRYAYRKKLRMTKQEVKDETKQTEGDPMVRSRLRAIRMARARQRMMAAVPKADVVVTNPTHFACALKYDQEKMNAPVLVAKGGDFVAKRIREVAEENNVPVVENPPLARALFASVEIDDEIPPEHYKAVAEVISYVMRLRDRKRRRW